MVTHMGRAVCTSATSVAFAQMRRAVCQRQLIFLFPFQILFSFSIVCLEHHYREDQQRSLLTQNLYPPSAFVYLLRLGLKNLVLFTLLIVFK